MKSKIVNENIIGVGCDGGVVRGGVISLLTEVKQKVPQVLTVKDTTYTHKNTHTKDSFHKVGAVYL